jgi:hypothetical protein
MPLMTGCDMTKLISYTRRTVRRMLRRIMLVSLESSPRRRTRPHKPQSAAWALGARKLGAFALLLAEQFRHFLIHFSKEERS